MQAIISLLMAFSGPKAIPPQVLAPAIMQEAKANHIDPIVLTQVILLESKGIANARHNHDHGLGQINEIHGLSGLCLYNWKCNLHFTARYLATSGTICAYHLGKLGEQKYPKECLTYTEKIDKIR
jgi:hypothetical protein